MNGAPASPAGLAQAVLAAPAGGRRRLVALAGGPASGKSTLAGQLRTALEQAGEAAAVVPMDGFHLDNRLLKARGLLARKGAPESFDLGGFLRLAAALGEGGDVVYPLFDRARDISIAGAREVAAACRTVIVEGNYLLFDEPGWRDLAPLWTLSIRLEVPQETVRRRLIGRWLEHGLSRAEAEARTDANDMPNAARIAQAALPADITCQERLDA